MKERAGRLVKFTDGNWLVREGFDIVGASFVHEVEIDEKNGAMTAHVAPRPVADRAAMLDTPLLSVRFSSPLPGVIRVRITHHAGIVDRGPHFEIDDRRPPVRITDGPEEAVLASGSLEVVVRKTGEWSAEFRRAGGGRVTRSGVGAAAYVRSHDGGRWVREELDLGVGECVYGLGERFTPFVKNGQTVDVWNRDGGTSTEQAYKNVPFYVTNRGYGVFVNHPELVSFEIASEKVSKAQFSVEGEVLEYFVIDGPTMKDVLEKYTALTGRPALPPAWSFGLWLSTSFTTDYDEATVNRFVDGMLERDIPLRVFHFDCFWMKPFHWCDFRWDERTFPDPEGMLRRLKAKGLKICVWINPYIAQRSPLFEEGRRNGYLVRRPNGDVWQWDLWQPGMGIVDFTNPEARRWFADKLRALVDMGVDCFKTDFGERIPTDVVWHDGSDPQKMHNYYTYLYNKVVFETLQEKVGRGEAVVFARSATAGSQRFPVHWGGDCYATYESMAETLRGGLSLGLSGFGFWSHDIGGFEQTATPDVYKRWLAFGLLSSHSRLHGSRSYRVPWLFDEEAVGVARFFTKLKYRLMPYLFAAACEAANRGVPVLRAMPLEFFGDPACDYLDRQYMLGGSLLVAPVFDAGGEVSYYLPKGRWTHLLSGEEAEGGSWRKERHDYFSLPLWVRPNSLVAFGREDGRPDYDYADGATLRLYALEDGGRAEATVYSPKGEPELCVVAERRGGLIEVRYDGVGKPWRLELAGVAPEAVWSVEGAVFAGEEGGAGAAFAPEGGAGVVRVRLGQPAG